MTEPPTDTVDEHGLPGMTESAAEEAAVFERLTPTAQGGFLIPIAVILVSGVLTFHLWGDLRFAQQGAEPLELGDAQALSFSTLADNSFVAIRGLPDYRNALVFEPKGDRYRHAFFRLLGTGSRVLVHADETSTRTDLDHHFVGRLRRFDRVPYAEQIRTYYVAKVRATRLFDLALVKRQLAEGTLGSAPLFDRAGDPLPVGPQEEVGIEVDFPEDLKVALSKKQFAVEEDAHHELLQLGVPLALDGETATDYLYILRIDPELLNRLIEQLEKRNLPFAARRERFTIRFGEVRRASIADGGLVIPTRKDHPPLFRTMGTALEAIHNAETILPWSRIASIQKPAPIQIPQDAWLLTENEQPSGFRWVLAVLALLLLFAAFNVWRLVEQFRRPPGTPA